MRTRVALKLQKNNHQKCVFFFAEGDLDQKLGIIEKQSKKTRVGEEETYD